VREAEVMLERIPEELKTLRQWHCWKKASGTKIPCQADGSAAKSNDPNTWTNFETACDASGYFAGVAFEITEPYTGIDLDGCLDEEGDLRQWAWEIMARFDGLAFIEVSPSGTGIKILTRAKKPKGMSCLHKIAPTPKQQIEVYDHSRFWTVTGDIWGGNDQIADGQAAVDWLNEKFFAKKPEPKPLPPVAPVAPVSAHPDALLKRAEAYVRSVPGAGEGSRNMAVFNLAGHLFSMIGDRSERLTESQVLDFVRQWNQALESPLGDEELQRTVNSASKNGTPRAEKPPKQFPDDLYPHVDLSKLLADIGKPRSEDEDDEAKMLELVPPVGIIRQVFEYYLTISHRPSAVMGMATAVSFCETLFGRRIRTHTDLRTNDYNVVIAPTGAGKESCETTITRIFWQADPSRVPLLPPDVQSGNGLVKAIHDRPLGLWICDEFGKVLEAILDRKSNNGHAKQIGTHLLKLYSKAAGMYGGAAHADGARNEIIQPHLCLLGLTTGQLFDTLDSKSIQDGLFGRIAFWPVTNRPKRRTARAQPVPEDLETIVRLWLEWEPANPIRKDIPKPVMIEMTPEALERWEAHANAIDEKMEGESESKAAIWGRVAARSMKLAIVHRAARLQDDPATVDWLFCHVEISDVDWGIKMANWLASISCGLIRENLVDRLHERAKAVLFSAAAHGIKKRDLCRAYRSISASEFQAAAMDLQQQGKLSITEEIPEGGGPVSIIYKSI